MTERRKSRAMIAAEIVLAVCLLAMLSMFPFRAKAQNPTAEQIFAPMEVFCTGAQKHIKNVLSKTGMFKDAFPLSGEGARQVSKNVFDHSPPADHVIIIRQTGGGSIMVPCVLGKNGPHWAGNQAQRVAVDFVFKRDLENPKTELPEQQQQPRKAKQ